MNKPDINSIISISGKWFDGLNLVTSVSKSSPGDSISLTSSKPVKPDAFSLIICTSVPTIGCWEANSTLYLSIYVMLGSDGLSGIEILASTTPVPSIELITCDVLVSIIFTLHLTSSYEESGITLR